MAELWMKGAIRRPGKLGGKGFLSRPKGEQQAILDACVKRWGYRSCLGSILFLERVPQTTAVKKRLAELRAYLVSVYGGAGSFGMRKNPPEFVLIPDLADCPSCRIRTTKAFEKLLREQGA